MADMKLTTISGDEVPIPTIVSPITNAEFERDSHQVLEAVKLSVDLANKVFRRILGFLGVFGGALLGRILHGGKDFFFFDDAHEAVPAM